MAIINGVRDGREECRALTAEKWDQFLQHFELRKVALGACTRDFGKPLCA
ncbi:MAG TPA: hypothetical protein VJ914_02995 [Pseudonocardiaceae bacterium]|nr:hypothetical protein [Pseudonocardiaceae bacterium]